MTDDEAIDAARQRDRDLADIRAGERVSMKHVSERQRVDRLDVPTMTESVMRAVMAQHGLDRAGARRWLDEAERERRADADAAEERERIQRAERRQQRLVAAILATGIRPCAELVPRIASGDLDETDALKFVRAWLGGPRRFIALVGDSGTGKTVAISFAVADAIRRRIAVRHVLESQLVELKRSTTDTARNELLEIQRHRGVLIVEESGQTLAADNEIAGLVVAQVHDARIAMPGCTMAQLGNISGHAAVQRYGTRWADRMREVGRVHELKLPPGVKSMRAAGAA